MPSSHVVDAHALIWYLMGSPRLGSAARTAMSDPTSELFVPAIALAEACRVVERGRTPIPSASDLLGDVVADPRIRLVPLDFEIVALSPQLTSIA